MSQSIPQIEPPMTGTQVPINYSIATGTVLVVDQCFAKPIVEKSELPDELKGIARGTLDIGALYGISKGTEFLGFGGAWSWSKLFGAFPIIAATQSIIGYGMHEMGFDPSETKNEVARIALSLVPLYFVQHFPNVYSAMMASMTGEGLSGISFTAPSGGAGMAGVGFQTIIIIGAFIIANQIAGGVTYVGGHITELNYEPDYPLMKRSYDLLIADLARNYFGDIGGMWFQGLFGNEIKIIQALASYASEKFEDDLVEGIGKFKNQSVEVTNDITKQVEDYILAASIESVKNKSFDWNIFDRSIRDYYHENKGGLNTFYNFVELTGYTVPSAVNLKKSISKEGYVVSQSEFKKYLINLIDQRYKKISDKLLKESVQRGLVKIENGEMFTTEAKNYTQNEDYLEKKAKTLKYLTKLRTLKLSLISNN